MPSSRAFLPNWTSAPGDTIADLLAQRHLTVDEFAERIGHSATDALGLLNGRKAITLDLARRLSGVFGASVEFWMSRDFQYQEDSARIQEEWIAGIPIEDMVKFGWIESAPDPSELSATVLRFFGANSVRDLRETYSDVQEMVAFRTSPAFNSEPAAVAAWLRRGEIQADEIACDSWNPADFQTSLSDIRSLTRVKDPKRFLPQLAMICARSGVAVVVVRAPGGCRASGATRFMSQRKALLLLSFRYLTDDHFWFTFFHEAGHLLLHGGKGLILEGASARDTPEEREANEFAARTLIPPESHPELLSLPANAREVIRFAVGIGVSPGIVVGQLQHAGRIPHRELNRLKRRYRW